MSITSEYEERLGPWSDIQGHMPFLRNTAAGYDRPVIIELGTRSGQSTSCFLAAIESSGGDLWSVDKDDAQVPEHWHRLPQWHFLKADDRSAEAMDWLPESCDILFVDTSHERRHTLDELRIYVPRVRKGGIALFHDTLLESDSQQGRFYVAEALDAYCAGAGIRWENRPGSYGMGFIRL